MTDPVILMTGDLEGGYRQLMERTKELTVLQSAGSILNWDMETKMPPKGVELKSEQMALLEKISHRLITDPENGRLLDAVEKHVDYGSLEPVKRRNVHLARKAYREATALPEELVVEIERQRTIGIAAWKKAKAAKDWALFKPELLKMKQLTERAYTILMDVKDAASPYDAMLDDYEPGMTAATVTKVFDEMKQGLLRVLEKVQGQDKPDTGFLKRRVPVEVQEKIADSLARFIGYDVSGGDAGGRIDATEHPFTTGYYTDVRVTTHYHEDAFASSIFSVLHEGGHALYEQGLPMEWMYQPVGTGCSYGVHESMSRFVENYVGKSPEFWGHYLPVLKGLTWPTLGDVGVEEMVKAVNYVTPSKIRIEADEVTYGMHIIIRFEIERDLFTGALSVDELPEAWNQKYDEYLGVTIENDAEGVMQDTHWAAGLFGYFPSYALGNIYDGVWAEKLTRDMPDWRSSIGTGDFTAVKQWLTENVYRYGNLYDPEDLVRHVTGGGLEVKPFIDYLWDKFSSIYGF